MDGNQADISVQQLGGDYFGEDLRAGNGKRKRIFAPFQLQRDLGTLLAPDDVAQLGGGHIQDALPLGAYHNIPGEHTRLLGAAAALHTDDLEAAAILRRRNGDADAHIGVFHLLLVCSIFLRVQVIAPTVTQGGNHGVGGSVLCFVHVRILYKAVFNQVFNLIQLGISGCFPDGKAQRNRAGGQGGGCIGENRYQFFHGDHLFEFVPKDLMCTADPVKEGDCHETVPRAG